MAYTSGFFDGDALYGQTEFNRYFDNIYESGVSVDDDNNMTCRVTVGTNISIAAGFAILKGFWWYNDAATTLTLPAAPSSNSRIDRVVLRLNVTNGTITPAVKQGTAAKSPVAPALTRTETTYEISLAKILRTASKNTLTDERSDNSVCGAIRPKNVSSYNNMISRMQSQFDAFMADKQSTAWRNIYVQSAQPSSPAGGSIWIQTT